MSEQEARVFVLEAIRTAIELIEFPECVSVEDDGEDIAISIKMQAEKSGALDVRYSPVSLITYFAECADSLLERIGKDKPDALNQEFKKVYVHSLAHGLLSQFHSTVTDFYASLPEFSWATLDEYLAHRNPEEGKQSEDANSTRRLDQWLRERSKAIRLTARNLAEGKLKPARHLIAHFYDLFLPEWKEAKAFYKRNNMLANWSELLVITYHQIDINLVERLCNPDPYLSMPSSIALEQAARMCGFRNDSLSRRTLNLYLKESREWIETNGNELKQAEIDKFFGRVAGDVGIQLRVAELAGTDEPEAWETLAHEFVSELMRSEPETVQ